MYFKRIWIFYRLLSFHYHYLLSQRQWKTFPVWMLLILINYDIYRYKIIDKPSFFHCYWPNTSFISLFQRNDPSSPQVAECAGWVSPKTLFVSTRIEVAVNSQNAFWYMIYPFIRKICVRSIPYWAFFSQRVRQSEGMLFYLVLYLILQISYYYLNFLI